MYVAVTPASLISNSAEVYKDSTRQHEEDIVQLHDRRFLKRLYRWLWRRFFYFNHGALLMLLTILIATVEDSRIRSDPGVTFFKIVFETVSAFGSVGLSLGYPGVYTSLSAQFRSFSKFLIILIFLQGRQRDLPGTDISYFTKIITTNKQDDFEDSGDENKAVINSEDLEGINAETAGKN
jgi:Trk-type K+ transport system membrane component